MKMLSEMIGWYAFLATVLYVSWYASKSFLHFVLDAGAAGEQVYFSDTVMVAGKYVWELAKATVFASACTVGVVIAAVALTDATLFSAIGYGSLTFFIGNFVTPKFMSKAAVDPVTSAVPAVAPVSHSDSSSADIVDKDIDSFT